MKAATVFLAALACAPLLGTAVSKAAGHPPQPVQLWGPVLQPNEQGRVMAEMAYSRLYGTNATYTHNNLFVFGRTDFVLGTMGVNALVNAARKADAQRRAAVQWRDHQVVTAVVTSARVMCKTNTRGWLNFIFPRIVEFAPDLDTWSVLLAFSGNAGPLRLTGPAAPEIALWIAHGLFGPQWMDDPRLSTLR
jgi:hypothetical protein